MDREELMARFMATRIPAPKTPARSARRAPTYKTCRCCGDMMVQDPRGGLICVNNCGCADGVSLSTQREMQDTKR